MAASDKRDSRLGADEMAGPEQAGDPPTASERANSPAEPESAFLYDPLAPEPGAVYDPLAADRTNPAAPDATNESTVGTGTSIALGCIAGSVFLIIIAIIILFLVSVFAN